MFRDQREGESADSELATAASSPVAAFFLKFKTEKYRPEDSGVKEFEDR